MKVWKYHPEQCELCGSDSEIFTEERLPEGYGYDGDTIRCLACGAVGNWSVHAEDDAFCNWDHDSGDIRRQQ